MTRRSSQRAVQAALLLGALLLAGAAAMPAPAGAEDAEISARRAAERKAFSDDEITRGFFKTVFGAELRLRGRTDLIRKYDGPVRVFIETRGKPDRSAANYFVVLVRERDLSRTVRRMYGRARAKRIARLEPQCLSGFRKDDSYRIVQSNILLVADAGDFIFYDCAFEELLQALGPINDTDVPWTMFNDDVQMGFFDVYDQYILNILYDPRIRPGMTADQVRALLPEILPTVRAWNAKVNDQKP